MVTDNLVIGDGASLPTVNVKYHCPCMRVTHLKALATWLFVQQFVKATDKENLKALYYWPFVCEGNLPATDGFPSQRARHVESASLLSWHHKCLIWLISPQTEMMVISHIKMKRLSIYDSLMIKGCWYFRACIDNENISIRDFLFQHVQCTSIIKEHLLGKKSNYTVYIYRISIEFSIYMP